MLLYFPVDAARSACPPPTSARTAVELAGVSGRSSTDVDIATSRLRLEETERRWAAPETESRRTSSGGRSAVSHLANWGWLGAEIPRSSAARWGETLGWGRMHLRPPSTRARGIRRTAAACARAPGALSAAGRKREQRAATLGRLGGEQKRKEWKERDRGKKKG
jgi:hypothetical protein